MLARLHGHPRDERIKFEEASHVYTIDDGKDKYTSVTTVIKPLFDEFNADNVIASMMRSKKWSESKYFGKTVEEIKAEWAQNGAQAAALGTKMHADIEAFYNDEVVVNDTPEFHHFLEFHQGLKTLKPYRTEWTVFDEELLIAGSIDMVYVRDDGDLVIYDWKRVKQIEKSNRFAGVGKHPAIAHLPDTNYWHYALQLNLYKFLLEKNYGVKVAGLCLVCLHPDKPKAEVVHVCDLQTEIAELFSLKP
jgi:ATP-dependent exoDNAse (exonuclease V) beta subunit